MSTLIHFVHALSPVHMGTGASTGGIDLPLAREPGTQWPVVPGSGFKGVLRGSDLKLAPGDVTWLFGAEWDAQERDQGALMFSDSEQQRRIAQVQDCDQGALMFSDLRLLCLPVRSYSGGWAWVTSPAALAAYRGEARWGLPAASAPPQVPAEPAVQAAVATGAQSPLVAGGAVYLHDVRFNVGAAAREAIERVKAWAEHLGRLVFPGEQAQRERELFAERLLLVSEAALGYLAKVAMDVRTRVRLVKRKAVAASGPWVEENLPVETLLWGSVAADAVQKADSELRSAPQAIETFARAVGAERRLQIGGKATVGRGVVRLVKAG